LIKRSDVVDVSLDKIIRIALCLREAWPSNFTLWSRCIGIRCANSLRYLRGCCFIFWCCYLNHFLLRRKLRCLDLGHFGWNHFLRGLWTCALDRSWIWFNQVALDRFGIYWLNHRLHNYFIKITYVLPSIKSFLLCDIVIITIFFIYTYCYNNFISKLLLIFTLYLLGFLRYPSNVNLSSWDIRSLISWRRWS